MCEDGKIQLVGGENESTEMEGRVEMCYNIILWSMGGSVR